MAKAQTDKEARKEERHEIISFIWFKSIPTSPDVASVEGIARTSDLSNAGLGIVTNQAIAIGTWLFVEIRTRRGSISAVACAMHERRMDDGRHRTGLSLVVVPPEDRQRLALLLGP